MLALFFPNAYYCSMRISCPCLTSPSTLSLCGKGPPLTLLGKSLPAPPLLPPSPASSSYVSGPALGETTPHHPQPTLAWSFRSGSRLAENSHLKERGWGWYSGAQPQHHAEIQDWGYCPRPSYAMTMALSDLQCWLLSHFWERWGPRERDLPFPSPTLLDHLLRDVETTSHLRDWNGRRWEEWLLLLPTLCPLVPLYPQFILFPFFHLIPASSPFLWIHLFSTSLYPIPAPPFLSLHSLVVQPLASFLSSLSECPDRTGWL